MSGTTARTGHYLLVEMPTPEEFLCGGRFRHPSRYRRKPSLSSLHQNRKMSSFKTAAIKIYQTKSCRIRSESPPRNRRTKGTQFWELQKGTNPRPERP